MLSAGHRRILRPSKNRQAQGHYVTDEQYVDIVILILFLRNIASDFENVCYNVPLYQLIYCQLIILQHVELKYEKVFVL